jgi:hypothetical protein
MKIVAIPTLFGLLLFAVAPAHGDVPPELTFSPTSGAVSAGDQKAIRDLLDKFIVTFSAQDFDAHFKLYHFPTVRIASGKVVVFQKVEEIPKNFLTTGLTPDYAKSEWTQLEIVQAGPNKVHIATVFRRLRKDGSEIERYPSLYILEKVDGRWGVRGRSSFAK